jgi:hypothetical protein
MEPAVGKSNNLACAAEMHTEDGLKAARSERIGLPLKCLSLWNLCAYFIIQGGVAMPRVCIKSMTAVLLLAGIQIVFSAPTGFFLLAPKNGSIYICKTGGMPRKIFTGNAFNAVAWSADAKTIFFMQGHSLWAMKNDGTDAHKLCDGYDTRKNPLATYRPDPGYVLYVEGKNFYRVRYTDGEKTLIHTDTKTYKGEIGISEDGKRMVGRVDKGAGIYSYKINVGGRSRQYHPTCSPSISPNGEYLLYTVSDAHRAIGVVKWDGSFVKEIKANTVIIDASKFAVNSNEYISNNHDQDSTVSLFNLSDGKHITVGNLPSEYPDFWVGHQLPNPHNSASAISPSGYPLTWEKEVKLSLIRQKSKAHGRTALFDIRGRSVSLFYIPEITGAGNRIRILIVKQGFQPPQNE